MANNNFDTKELNNFKKISYELGKNNQLVQGAGGNTSIKSESSILIKASGKWLIKSLKNDIFVELNLNSIKRKINQSKEDNFIEDVIFNNNLRPSVETSFHALIDFKYVLHVHSIATIANSIFYESEKLLKKILGDDIVYIPYVRPGFPLTMVMKNLIKKDSRVIILENHGLIVAGDNLDNTYHLLLQVHRNLDKIINTYNIENFNDSILNIPGYTQKNENKYKIFKTDNKNFLSAFSKSFYPDHVAFLGPGIPFFDSLNDAKTFILNLSKKNIQLPPFFIIKKFGLFENSNVILVSKEMIDCFIEVLLRINFNLTLKSLTKEEENELLNWDAEIYRKSIN